MRARTAFLCAALTTSCAFEPSAGSRSSAIVDGREATAADATGLVALVEPGGGDPICTGTLIEPDVVVTAAHCVATRAPADLAVVAGALTLGPAAPSHTVTAVAVHPGFPGPPSGDPTGLGDDRDIAVLLLAGTATETTPVPILPADRVTTDLAPGQPLTLAGYGSTRTDGMPPYGTLYLGDTTVTRRTDTELLAGEGTGADTCYVDSGGPAFVDRGAERHLAAITSRATQLATTACGDGTLFTLPSAHRDFLADALTTARRTDDDGGCSISAAPAGSHTPLFVLAILVAVRTSLWPRGRARRRRRP